MTGARRREPAAARRGVSGAVPSGGMLGRTPEGQALAGREAAGGGVSGCGARKIPPMCEQSGRGVAKTGNYLYLCAVPSAERHFCGNSSVGRASASQAEGRGFESRFPLNKEKHYKSNTYDLWGNIFKDKVQHKSLKKRSAALFCT